MTLELYLIARETDGLRDRQVDVTINPDAVRLDDRFAPVTHAAQLVGERAWIHRDQSDAWTGIEDINWGETHTTTRARVLAAGIRMPEMRMPAYELGQPTAYINVPAVPKHKVIVVPNVGLEFLAETMPRVGKEVLLSVTPGGPADGIVGRLVVFNTSQSGGGFETATLTGVGYGIQT